MNAVDVKTAPGAADLVESDHSDSGSDRPGALGAVAIAMKFAELKSSPQGLTSEEATTRLAKDGPNAIVAKEEPLWHKLFGYFWGPIPWMIEAAAIISLVRADWPDFLVVTGPPTLQRRRRLLAGR